jgi:hypothetical protein
VAQEHFWIILLPQLLHLLSFPTEEKSPGLQQSIINLLLFKKVSSACIAFLAII